MIRIGSINNRRSAQAFVDYMLMQGIQLRIEQTLFYDIMLDDEHHLARVEDEFSRFMRYPDAACYQAASWQTGRPDSRMHYTSGDIVSMIRLRAGALTLFVLLGCVVIFVLMHIIGTQRVMLWLSWPDGPEQYRQLWRLFSHALLHFSLLHLLFNLLWWWYLGGALEKRLGSGKLLSITLMCALLSGFMEARFSGVWFGGLSGVVYGLMGYCWLRGERDPQSGVWLERGLMAFALLWLVMGFVGIPGLAMANAAHLSGLLTGLVMGFVDSRKRAAP